MGSSQGTKRIHRLIRQQVLDALLSDLVLDGDRPCTFPAEFKPNPGGQQQFFEMLPCDRLTDVEPRVIWLRGGVNSGKSTSGAAFACSRALHEPESRGLITANSYGQLETSTLLALAEFCDRFNIPLYPKANSPEETAKAIAARRLCKIFDAQVLVLSAEAFTGKTQRSTESGRGLQVRWAWADEYAYADQSAFNTINGRIGRGPGKMKGVEVITSSINKNNVFNYLYDLFESPDRTESQQKMFLSINCPTMENVHADADFVASQKASLTPELEKIELFGQFVVASTNRVFDYFDRQSHVLYGEDAKIATFDPRLPLHISFDFNRSPSCAIAAQKRGQEVLLLKEWYIPNCGTMKLSSAVVEWVRSLQPLHQVHIHGDASGSQARSNADKTDWELVFAEFRRHKIRTLQRFGKSNPSVKGSVNTCNVALYHSRVCFHYLCKELIKDLESLQWKEGKQEIDKSDLARSHLADCFRYLINDLLPLPQENNWKVGTATYSR